MLAIKIWNYLKGYVIIRIEGLMLERLLNLALSNNIYLWDVKRLNYFQVEVAVSPKGLFELEELIDRLGCKGQVLVRKGLPYFIEKLKRRKMFTAGFAFFFASIIFLSTFIWKIEINGVEQTPKEGIIKYLEENGISYGSNKMNLSVDEIKMLLINKYKYFSFIEVQFDGVKLLIDIKEEDIPLEIVDKDYPANIIARKKGVITKIIARNGESTVDVGQIVKENQILISGVIQSGDGSFYQVHADGQVMARTRYDSIVEEPIVKIVEKETGKLIEQKGLKIGNRGIKFIKDIPYDNYKEYIKESNILDWDLIDFPVKLITYEYKEVELTEIKQEIDYLKRSNQMKALEIINAQLYDGAEIISKDVIHSINDNILKTAVIVETNEDIGKKSIINN